MNQAAYAMNLFNNNDRCVLSTSSFSELTQHALWGAQLNMGNQVVATHQELAMLRQCAEHASEHKNCIVHVISSCTQKQVYYLVKTLMHFGISCGQIIVRKPGEGNDCPEGVWLFVEEVSAVS